MSYAVCTARSIKVTAASFLRITYLSPTLGRRPPPLLLLLTCWWREIPRHGVSRTGSLPLKWWSVDSGIRSRPFSVGGNLSADAFWDVRLHPGACPGFTVTVTGGRHSTAGRHGRLEGNLSYFAYTVSGKKSRQQCSYTRRNLVRYWPVFYRAMHLSAYARSWDRMSSVCLSVRLSVRPSVCNVGGLWSHRLEISETNCTDN